MFASQCQNAAVAVGRDVQGAVGSDGDAGERSLWSGERRHSLERLGFHSRRGAHRQARGDGVAVTAGQVERDDLLGAGVDDVERVRRATRMPCGRCRPSTTVSVRTRRAAPPARLRIRRPVACRPSRTRRRPGPAVRMPAPRRCPIAASAPVRCRVRRRRWCRRVRSRRRRAGRIRRRDSRFRRRRDGSGQSGRRRWRPRRRPARGSQPAQEAGIARA